MKSLLLCTDGSRYSEVCTRYAAWLAERGGADLCALYLTDIRQFEVPFVADLSGSLGIQPYPNLIGQIEQVEKEKARIIRETTEGIAREAGFDKAIAFHHKTGLLVDHLEDMEDDTDIILMGKRGAGADAAIGHLGSNLERVVRAARKPVLVTSRAFRDVNRVLLAYDGSKLMQAGLDWFCRDSAFKGLDVHLVTVIEEDMTQDEGRELYEQAEEKLRAGGFDPSGAILYGEVDKAIEGYVESEKIDLLAIGAYGRSRWRELFIGSTTTTLIRSCFIPVLCFR